MVLIAALALMAGSFYLATFLPTTFIGSSGQNTLSVSQSMPAGTSLEAADRAAKVVEEELSGIDGVETVQVSVGSSGNTFAVLLGGGSDTSFSITTDPDADQTELRSEVSEAIDGLDPDVVGEVAVSSGGGGGFSSDIAVEISAPDQESLRDSADQVLEAMRELEVTQQAESNLSESLPYIAIDVDREAAAEAGLSEVAVGGIVADSMLPASIGSVVIDRKTLDIYITDPRAPTTLQGLRDLQIPSRNGLVPLSSLASVEEVEGPSSVTTVRGVRSATVTVTPDTEDIGTASAAVQAALDELDLPDGASAEVGGVATDQADAFSQLTLAVLAAILIVYTIMVATFRSLRQPLLLLVSIPFAATGAVLLQLASGIPLGVPSIIGLLMLVGIVVTNAIVLVDLVNQYRDNGMRVRDAIIHGAARRLRPILMTALATIGALLPMAIGVTGHGGFISQPLAIIVIGGLVSSTLLTLIVLPTLYWVVEGAKERRDERRVGKGQTAPKGPRKPKGPATAAVLPSTAEALAAAAPPAVPAPEPTPPFEPFPPLEPRPVDPPPAPVPPARIPPAPSRRHPRQSRRQRPSHRRPSHRRPSRRRHPLRFLLSRLPRPRRRPHLPRRRARSRAAAAARAATAAQPAAAAGVPVTHTRRATRSPSSRR